MQRYHKLALESDINWCDKSVAMATTVMVRRERVIEERIERRTYSGLLSNHGNSDFKEKYTSSSSAHHAHHAHHDHRRQYHHSHDYKIKVGVLCSVTCS